ncbi:MAG: hypothetical protein AAGD25_21570 [Cyanobacteria bacterium P01_F01_bin.150]
MLTLLFAVVSIGWLAAAVIGTQAYFRGEQSKPVHERNWNSAEFEQLSRSVTGQSTDLANRIPAYTMDAYASNQLAS